MQRLGLAALVVALGLAPGTAARADGLAGSPSSMVHQHAVAVEEDYSFLRTSKDVHALATKGALVPVADNANFALSGVSYPYARPEVLSFVQHFAASYRRVTGSRLIVTSLTRPTSAQPANAHKLSVHPAGMAVDLRVPTSSADRAYLESSLLALEKEGVLDVTRERSPAHYHVAVFAEPYIRYASRQDSIDALTEAARVRAADSVRVANAAVAAITPTDSESPARLLITLGALLALAGPLVLRTPRSRRA